MLVGEGEWLKATVGRGGWWERDREWFGGEVEESEAQVGMVGKTSKIEWWGSIHSTYLIWRWESQTHVSKSNFRENGEACFPSFHNNMISCRSFEKYNPVPHTDELESLIKQLIQYAKSTIWSNKNAKSKDNIKLTSGRCGPTMRIAHHRRCLWLEKESYNINSS